VKPANIVGARYSLTGRTFDFDAGALELARGELIVVQDRRGTEIATVSVASGPRKTHGLHGRVVRRALDSDRQRLASLRRREAEAVALAKERARARGLSIKVFRAELSPGGERALIYFSSEQRVDFRELVGDLGTHLRARIELRQVGVRDEAKMVGGIGSCGLELCCTTFLPRFAPVSIKMAKNQNLALTPAKVSGQCGRLKCCLVYEDANYIEAAKKLPKLGKRVETPAGEGRVEDLNSLAGRVRVSFPDKPPVVFAASDLRWSTAAAPLAGASGEDPPSGVLE
jgi:cell fate regulator YaaT (PSP1 superfamily)